MLSFTCTTQLNIKSFNYINSTHQARGPTQFAEHMPTSHGSQWICEGFLMRVYVRLGQYDGRVYNIVM